LTFLSASVDVLGQRRLLGGINRKVVKVFLEKNSVSEIRGLNDEVLTTVIHARM
jgi:hypothetical protein